MGIELNEQRQTKLQLTSFIIIVCFDTSIQYLSRFAQYDEEESSQNKRCSRITKNDLVMNDLMNCGCDASHSQRSLSR